MIRNFVLLNLLLNQTPMVVFVTNIGAHGTTPEQKKCAVLDIPEYLDWYKIAGTNAR